MEFIKKNLTLIAGIAIPVLMVILVAASIYLPTFFIKPQFDFLYVKGFQQYAVKGNKLVSKDAERTGNKPNTSQQLFVYVVATDESKEISFQEAQNLNLDASALSPDSFEIVSGKHREGFFPIFSDLKNDYTRRYIKHEDVSKQLHLQLSGTSNNNFRFIGWIK